MYKPNPRLLEVMYSPNFRNYLQIKDIDLLIKETIDKVNYEFALPDPNFTITWEWSNRMTSTRGYARCAQRFIKFSRPLFERSKIEGRKRCVVHETCHILAHELFGPQIKPHGSEWKDLMIFCGEKPLRCHSVNRTGLYRPQTRVAAFCGCKGIHWITKNRSTRMKKGQNYICNKCKATLRLQK